MLTRLSCLRTLAFACLAAALAACAHVAQTPALLVPAAAAEASQTQSLAAQLEIDFDTGYHRTVRAGSQWLRAGSLPQGAVFKPYKDVFALEGAHVHEAYLVVHTGKLVGFYLPAERAFSPLQQPLPVTFQ